MSIYTPEALALVTKIDEFADAIGGPQKLMIHVKLGSSDLYHTIQSSPSQLGDIIHHNSVEVVRFMPPGEALLETKARRKW